jgi:DinB superfamily
MRGRPEHVGKSELLSRLRTSRDKMAMILEAIPPSLFLHPQAIGRWSVRDLLAHFVAHQQRALAEIAAGRRGERLALDPNDSSACNWLDPNDSSACNAGAVFAWSTLLRVEALAAWERSCGCVIGIVEELTEADFAPDSSLERALGDTVDGALANNTYAHYAEHLPALEAFVERWRPARLRSP